AYLQSIPADRVQQFHLAGHTDLGTHCIDTHDGRVVDRVWELYRAAVGLTGGAATLLEWDVKIPTFEEVHAEALKAKAYVSGREGQSADDAEYSVLGTQYEPGSDNARSTFPHPAHYIAAEAE
ncbi:MAG TPA: DUF692 family protein, partial [Pirellulales bacterium]